MQKRKTLEEKICDKLLDNTQILEILQANSTRISSTEILNMSHINNLGIIIFEWLIKNCIFSIIEQVGARTLNFDRLKRIVTLRCKPVLENYIEPKGAEKKIKLNL